MKIVHLLKHAVQGNGSVHVAVDLACEQAAQGHQVWFLSARGSYDDLLRARGVHVHPVPEPSGVRGAVGSLIAQTRLVLRVRPQVLHAHMMSSAVIGAVVALLGRAVLIATMHNSFDRHSGLMRVARAVVAVSKAEQALLLKRGYRSNRLAVVLNGTSGSPRESLELEDAGPLHTPSVMTLSGLHARKAVDDIIRAFALVHPEFPHWHLNVVGWGPDLERLRAQARDSGLEDVIHFLGSTRTPMPLLKKSEIFATASLAEPFGLNVMEARVAGCAVVGTRVGGIPEVLEDGRAGQLVAPRDPGAIAEVLRHLMRSPEELARWRAASLHGSDYFSVSRMARDYDAVYERFVPRRRG